MQQLFLPLQCGIPSNLAACPFSKPIIQIPLNSFRRYFVRHLPPRTEQTLRPRSGCPIAHWFSRFGIAIDRRVEGMYLPHQKEENRILRPKTPVLCSLRWEEKVHAMDKLCCKELARFKRLLANWLVPPGNIRVCDRWIWQPRLSIIYLCM